MSKTPIKTAYGVKCLREDRDLALAKANYEIAQAVNAARETGVPWQELADAMNMTRYGLYKFLRRV